MTRHKLASALIWAISFIALMAFFAYLAEVGDQAIPAERYNR